MKKISAVLMVLAVLNPLCCCYTFATEVGNRAVEMENHDCCGGNSEDNKGAMPAGDDCPHKVFLDEDARIAQDQQILSISLPANLDQVKDVIGVASLQDCQASLKISPLSTATIVPWIQTQTDCVRLL